LGMSRLVQLPSNQVVNCTWIFNALLAERILTLPPAHDRTSLSSFGGEGWGEEAALSESHCRPGLQTRRCPSPQPSPPPRLAGRGRNLWWQCQDAPECGTALIPRQLSSYIPEAVTGC